MNKLLKYLPFQFICALVVGILTQYYTNFWNFGLLNTAMFFLIFLLLLSIMYWQNKKILFSFFAWVLFVFVGVLVTFSDDTRNYSNYFINYKTDQSTIVLEITRILKPNQYNQKYYANVIQVDKNKTIGKVLLNVKQDSTKYSYNTGDRILLNPNFQKLKPPKNPYSFSFQKYLRNKGVFYQIYTQHNYCANLDSNPRSIMRYAYLARKYISDKLKQYTFSEDELSVINALLLGERNLISSDMTQSYVRAGATHILAVSGLHIGIILYILSFVLKPIRSFQNGKLISFVLILVLLWSYALLAGLSASIVRAVTMFSFISFGQFYKRKMSVVFSLVSSMFILLLLNPLYLFDVGFQLSYSAVFAIVYLQPKFAQYYRPKNWVITKIWQVVTVSIAAQIGVLPLSLFYFHNLPLLFLASNLVIIPFLGIILGIGFVVILFSLLGVLTDFMVVCYATLIRLQNTFIHFIASQNTFFIEEISVSLFFLIVLYIVIILGTRFLFFKREPKVLIYFLIFVLILSAISLFEEYQKYHIRELIVFNKPKNTVLGIRDGKRFVVYSSENKNEVFLKSYTIAENISMIQRNKIKNLYEIKNQKVIIVDESGIFDIKGLKNTIVFLRNSPKINLNRLISCLEPKCIVADASNYISYVNRWRETSKKQKTPFHYTNEDGAFVLN